MEPNSSGLADAAIRLGQDKVVMDHYFLFQQHKIGWFFSPNPNLAHATRRPGKLGSWKDWFGLSAQQKRTIASLSGFKEDATDIVKDNAHLIRLKAGFKAWRRDLYCIPWGNKDKGTFTCNLFVGDAIYLWRKKSITNAIGHYYSPEEIAKGISPLRSIKPHQLERGHIVVFGTYHMEIVSQVANSIVKGNGFCSFGTGRETRAMTGAMSCENPSTTREILAINNRYYSVI